MDGHFSLNNRLALSKLAGLPYALMAFCHKIFPRSMVLYASFLPPPITFLPSSSVLTLSSSSRRRLASLSAVCSWCLVYSMFSSDTFSSWTSFVSEMFSCRWVRGGGQKGTEEWDRSVSEKKNKRAKFKPNMIYWTGRRWMLYWVVLAMSLELSTVACPASTLW